MLIATTTTTTMGMNEDAVLVLALVLMLMLMMALRVTRLVATSSDMGDQKFQAWAKHGN